jgi:hypothetical protein
MNSSLRSRAETKYVFCWEKKTSMREEDTRIEEDRNREVSIRRRDIEGWGERRLLDRQKQARSFLTGRGDAARHAQRGDAHNNQTGLAALGQQKRLAENSFDAKKRPSPHARESDSLGKKPDHLLLLYANKPSFSSLQASSSSSLLLCFFLSYISLLR